MEQVQKSAQSTSRSMSDRCHKIKEYLQHLAQKIADMLRVYVNQYPPFAAFLFTLLIFSVIPVTLYALFAAITIAFTLSIAMIGFSIVEITILLGGAGCLLVVLFIITVVTGVIFSWLVGFWLAYRFGYMLLSKFGSSASSLTDAVSGQIRSAAEATGERLHQLQSAAQEQASRVSASMQQQSR